MYRYYTVFRRPVGDFQVRGITGKYTPLAVFDPSAMTVQTKDLNQENPA